MGVASFVKNTYFLFQGEPNNVGEEDCVSTSIEKDGRWVDRSCNVELYFVCKHKGTSSYIYHLTFRWHGIEILSWWAGDRMGCTPVT